MNKLSKAWSDFLHKDSATGILLIIATLSALIVANTPLRTYYQAVMHLNCNLGFDSLYISQSLHHWVNDGLMSLFFLLVGLEIKSELKFGRLRSFKSAVCPVVAAVTGASVPALIYFAFNRGTEYIDGWAIP